MTYYPINTDPPGLHSRLLAAVTDGFIYPQLPYVPARSESVYATALVYSPLLSLGPENIAVYLTASYTRFGGAAFRHLGVTVDVELYLDSYSYVTSPIVGGVYPPADPLALPFEGYYTRTTMGYVYAGIPVPAASDLVWDARWPVVLSPTGAVTVSTDRVGPLRAQVADIINTSRTPSFTMSLGGAANTSRLPATGPGEYPVLLERFLETYYKSVGIPPIPTVVGDLLVTLDFSASELLSTATTGGLINSLVSGDLASDFTVASSPSQTKVSYRTKYRLSELFPQLGVFGQLPTLNGTKVGTFTGDYSVALPAGYKGDIAAIVDGDYFVEWVFLVRSDATASSGGGLSNLSGLSSSS